MLKVGLGDLRREAATLAAWHGRGAVRLLRQGDDALLLERAEPGTPAATLVPDDDERATAAAVRVLRQLHAGPPPAAGVPALGVRLQALDDHLRRSPSNHLLPRALVDRARGVAAELQLAEGLGQPPDRIAGWGFVQAVLSAVWSAQTGAAPMDRALDAAALLTPRPA